MRKLGTFLLLLMTVLWIGISTGCTATNNIGGGGSGATGASGGSGGSGGSGASGGQGGDGGCVFENCNQGGSGGVAMGVIDLNPKNPIVTVENGVINNIPFTATLNGQDVTNQVVWVFDRPEVGDIGASAAFVPTGIVGGLGNLTAKYSNAEGSTTVTVFIKKVVNSGNLPQATIDQLDNPNGGADPNISIAYPYPKTVFPLGVLSPEIQWFGGQANDSYKLRITEKYYDYTEYMTKSPPGRHIVAQADWDAIEKSGSGSQSDPVTVALGRLSGGVAYEPELNTWHIAQGKLKGNIYYWELPDLCGNASTGRILRIKPDAEQVDEFFTPGGCWGCHTVSRDGKTMMATLDSGSPFPQVTVDLSVEPAVYGSLGPGTPIGGTFSAFNEKGDKALVSNDGAFGDIRLRIVDVANGATLNDNAMGNMCGEPAWSPTGKKIAAICNLTSANWIFDSSGGNLFTADVADDGVTVSNINMLVPQAGGQGRPAYPSFSPGGEWIAFGRTTQGSRTTGAGELWLVDVNNGANQKKLSVATLNAPEAFNPAVMVPSAYNPVFAPLRAGGYFWLVYVSRADYGNRLNGTSRQQLWITAIDDPPTAADPSHPPFYVRGQEDCAKSENAYFALPPCKDKGQACETGADCCEGQCLKDADTGMYVCGDPPDPGMCSQDGNACVVDLDCCNFNPANPNNSTTCVDGFCQPPIPE